MPVTVALAHCADYTPELVQRQVDACLQAAGLRFGRGERVLLKPNLLKAADLACTHPQVVRAACVHVLEHGARPFVADSPAFGSGRRVARAIGLSQALQDLDVPVRNMTRPVRCKLPMGRSVGLSRDALEADAILNLPKLKAHCQMRITGAVKNLFGCVPGTRKAVLHTLHGDMQGAPGAAGFQAPRFESLIIELAGLLPPTSSLLDGVTAMHVQGPSGGRPYPLKLLAASREAVALDTAVYTVLGATPEDVPLWREARRRNLAGAHVEELEFPLKRPEAFDAAGFELPAPLDPQTFHPLRLGVSAVKRAWARIA